MKYLLLFLLFACNDGGSEPEIIKADSSAVDPGPGKDTVKIDTAVQFFSVCPGCITTGPGYTNRKWPYLSTGKLVSNERLHPNEYGQNVLDSVLLSIPAYKQDSKYLIIDRDTSLLFGGDPFPHDTSTRFQRMVEKSLGLDNVTKDDGILCCCDTNALHIKVDSVLQKRY